MINSQPSRIGIYPVCATDFLEPLQMLKGWVDHLIFCDIKYIPRNHRDWVGLRETVREEGLPQPSFFLADALFALECLHPVDVFFLRRDSNGEGGSELNLLGNDRLPMVLSLIKPEGLLVTDRQNGRVWFSEFISEKISQHQAGNKVIRLAEDQPWKDHGLRAFKVEDSPA